MFAIRLRALLMVLMIYPINFGGTLYVPRSTTPEWKTKIKLMFDMMDADQDGYVTKEEYVDLTTQRAEAVLPSWRAKAVYGILSENFPIWWSNKMTNYSTSVSWEAFLHSAEVSHRMQAYVPYVDRWASDWFHTYDLDCNGELSVDEYANYLKTFRDIASVEIILKANDSDENGVIDEKEFWNALWHQFYDEESYAGALAYGSVRNAIETKSLCFC